MGGDFSQWYKDAKTFVSIHAPVWGATEIVQEVVIPVMFQSTPPYGGRLMLQINFKLCLSFNPRPRMGGDHHGGQYHADGRGFNPRPRMGGDCSTCN